MKTVVAWGTFDVLHLGHINFLNQAKDLGERLIVLLGRDKVVAKVKGKPPLHNENERLEMIKNLKMVDEAYLDREETDFALLRQINPDIVCLGYDQVAFTEGLEDKLKSLGLKATIVRLEPFGHEKYKSSKIKEILRTK